MNKKYNYNVIFRKLEEVKKEQGEGYTYELSQFRQISEEVEKLKNIYEDISEPDVIIYTRT